MYEHYIYMKKHIYTTKKYVNININTDISIWIWQNEFPRAWHESWLIADERHIFFRAVQTTNQWINLGNTSVQPLRLTGNIQTTVYHSATFSHIDSSFHFIFLLPHHLCQVLYTVPGTLRLNLRGLSWKRARVLHVSCVGALVFHLDPAAPVPASAAVDLSSPLITAPLITSQLLITTSHHNSSQLITYLLITAPLLTPHSSQLHCSSQLITAPLVTGPLLITSHRSTSHHNSSQLITSQLITVPLLTPHFSHLTYHITTSHHNLSHPNSSQLHFSHHLSHQNSSQLHFSHLTSQVPLLTTHFSHLPEVHIKLRYIKAWHVGLSGPFILRQQLIHQTYSCYFLENTCWLRLFKLLTRAENSATALSTLMFQSRRVRSQRPKVAISLEFPSGCV